MTAPTMTPWQALGIASLVLLTALLFGLLCLISEGLPF